MIKSALLAFSMTLAASAPSVMAAEKAVSLDQLLKQVEQGRISEVRDNKKREARFLAQRNTQKKQLADAKKTRIAKEKESARLEKLFEENERLLTEKQRQLKDRMGNLTELFGHLTSSSGDLRSVVENSLTSVQYPGREQFLDELIDKMNGSERLPSIAEVERLWFEIQREMTESGRIASFDTTVVTPGGDKATQKVVRIGSFNVINEQGEYLTYENGTLSVLARQPSGSYQDWGRDLGAATAGLSPFGIDPTGPSGGSYLAALIDSPDLRERWEQGGIIGYIITGVGVFALLLGLFRLMVLSTTALKVKGQLKSDSASSSNPLGRVLKVYEDNPETDPETLELKLSEAVIREVPKIESGLNLLKIISAVAPLLGLLGTVTGMIITFQAITIHGAGDPQAMAGGISGALVTTVLGLVVAIPTVLLHTIVNSRAKNIINIIVEQSTGIVAQRTEQYREKLKAAAQKRAAARKAAGVPAGA